MSSFHYELILSKRSSLAKVWLAAHWEKKLSKVQVYETNLQSSAQDILNPRTPIALRTSSHLLVGLVRIYSRKAKYLLSDCSETLVNIRVSFRPGVASLNKPKKKKTAQDMLDCPLFITEKVDLLDQWVPDVSNAELDCSLNQSKAEEITLQEEPMKVNTLEDYFEDEGFGDMMESVDSCGQALKDSESVFSRVYSFADSACGTEDGFPGETAYFSDFSDPFFSLTPIKESDLRNKPSEVDLEDNVKTDLFPVETADELIPKTTPTKRLLLEPLLKIPLENFQDKLDDNVLFTLDPVEKQSQQKKIKSLKRKLIIDPEISTHREAFFDQLHNTDDLLIQPVFAPRTKRHMKATLQDKLYSLFAITLPEHIAPCFKDFLKSPTSSKNSFPATPLGMDTAMDVDDEGEFSAAFIPLHDVDYSSDEEEMPQSAHESISNFLGSTNDFSDSPSSHPYLTDHLTEPAGSHHNETADPATNEDEASDFDQEEDISQDEFCVFVEKTVMEANPTPVNFGQVACKEGTLTRKTVARKFLKCLLMQRDARIHLEQTSHFSPILLHSGTMHTQNVEVAKLL